MKIQHFLFWYCIISLMGINIHKYIGDRDFYRMVMTVALPAMIQQAISTFVSLLDNVMIGQVGTLAMSAVSVSNQLLFVVNLAIIGSINAAAIFGTQYYGKKDNEGLQQCFRFKVYIGLFFCVVGILILMTFGENILNLYMDTNANSAESIATTMEYALSYIDIMLIGIFPYAISMVFGSAMRDTGRTVIQMIGSTAGVAVNFCLNYTLIFGHFGFPALGVAGAAIATVISRYVEMGIVLIGTFKHRNDYCSYIKGAFKKLSIPMDLVKKIIIKGTPLVCNEVFWSMGLAAITQKYSSRGLDAIAAVNISDTISNLFSMASMGLGTSVSVIVGQRLGAGKIEEAKDIDRKMVAFAAMMNTCFLVLLFLLSPYLPKIYQTDEEVHQLATNLIRITALMLPAGAIYSCSYFTLRAGGKTVITFLFDSGYTCTITLLTATLLTAFTDFNILQIYLCVKLLDIPKAIIGIVLLRKGVWIHNLVSD